MKNGIYSEYGDLYYYEKDDRCYKGLFIMDGHYYYATRGGKVITGRDYWIVRANGLKPFGKYSFDEVGRMTEKGQLVEAQTISPDDPEYDQRTSGRESTIIYLPDEKEGILEEEGELFYYEKDQRVYKGLFQVENDFYYATRDGKVITNREYWIVRTNGLLPFGKYTFDGEGKLVK